MVTNLSLMNKSTMDYLIREQVSLCTSLDGPAWLHDRYRRRADGSSGTHAKVARWIQEINRLNQEGRYRHRIGALLTTTRQALAHPEAIIDEYRRLGLRSIFLRTMTTFASPSALSADEAYGPQEFFDFYRRAMEYILALNKKGESFVERKTLILLAKIFDAHDPDFMDLRSPCGAAIGQLAYNYNGDVYTCDEGRMLGRCQDDTFRIGRVFKDSYATMMRHATVSAMCVASCLENLPGCHDCAYAPYCGVCPLLHYKSYGSLFRPHKYSDDCSLNEKVLDFIFQKCQNIEDKDVFLSWLRMPPQKKDAL
jgi:radical SAM protein with 4Fe4S-binding SPASM domain